LCRRAFRSDHCPAWSREAVARVAGSPADKLSDDQVREMIGSDPVVAQTLLTVGKLSQNGRLERGDGHQQAPAGEREPAYPHQPDFYRGRPDSDPEKQWFLNRGAQYQDGHYVGGFSAT
jgi:hypothetical protein